MPASVSEIYEHGNATCERNWSQIISSSIGSEPNCELRPDFRLLFFFSHALRNAGISQLLMDQEESMDSPIDEAVAARAYELWERAGKPEGRDEEFWHLAEQQLLNEDRSSPLRTPDNL